MIQFHRDLLTSNRLLLVRGIKITPAFLACLNNDNTLTQEMIEMIESKKTNSEKAGELLTTMSRRGPRAFDRLVWALVETDQEHLASSLDKKLTIKYMDSRDVKRAKEKKNKPQQAPMAMDGVSDQNPMERMMMQMMQLQQQMQQQQYLMQQQQMQQQLTNQTPQIMPAQQVSQPPSKIRKIESESQSSLGGSICGQLSVQSEMKELNEKLEEPQECLPSLAENRQSKPIGAVEVREGENVLVRTNLTVTTEVHRATNNELGITERIRNPAHRSTQGDDQNPSEGSSIMSQVSRAESDKLSTPTDAVDKGQSPSQSHARSDDGIQKILDIFHKDKFLDIPIPNADTALIQSDEVYAVRNSIRGRAVIINNTKFSHKGFDERHGADADGKNLQNLFQKLHFNVICYKNLTAEEIRSRLTDESKHEEHYDADMFVLFILTHGRQGAICGTDGGEVIIETITDMFDGNNCPALNGKPKLFFLQACQGDKKSASGKYVTDSNKTTPDDDDDDDDHDDDYDNNDDYGEVGGSETSRAKEWEEEETSMIKGMKRLRIAADEALKSDIHEKADMLIAYATVQEYKAWRRTDNGSWFVRCIVFVFSMYSHKDHVSDLLTTVNRVLSQLRTDPEEGSKRYRQIGEKRDTLTKKVFFFPGYKGDEGFDTVC